MQVNDDYYSGNAAVLGVLKPGSADNPTAQAGAGPLGRVFFLNVIPLTVQVASVAALQAQAAGVPLTLAAGTGVTAIAAPDGSGRTAYKFDTPRGCSLTSVSNLSAGNFTISGFDFLGRPMTQKRAGPNNNTVNTLKAFDSILAVVPDTTNAGTVSIGSSDVFGLPYFAANGSYVQDAAWNATTGASGAANGANNFALDTGTFIRGDVTTPATSATGDPRGTYTPSSASDGLHQLIVCLHLDGTQCGANSTLLALMGVTPA